MQLCIRAHDLKVFGERPIIDAVKKAGADGVQLVCYKSFADVYKASEGIKPAKAEIIGNEFKENLVDIKLLGAYFNPVHTDMARVDSGIKIFKDYLKAGKLLGCNVVGSETGSFNDEPWIYHPLNRTDEALSIVVDTFRKLCDYALEYDAVVGIEGASGHVCYDVKTLNSAVNRIDRDNIKIIFDLYNFLDDSNYKNYIEILKEGLETFKEKIHCFHIKDCYFTDNGYEQCSVGQGDLDFIKILSLIKSYDENAVLILEGTKREDIKQSVEFVKKAWDKA